MFDNEQDRVHVDEGWLIYMPNCPHDTCGTILDAIRRHGKILENIIWKDDDLNTHQFILLDEDMEILAVNITSQ